MILVNPTVIRGVAGDFYVIPQVMNELMSIQIHVYDRPTFDIDFHTHKLHLLSRVITGKVINIVGEKVKSNKPVYICRCTHATQKLELSTERYSVNEVKKQTVAAGGHYSLKPDVFHKVEIPEPTITICTWMMSNRDITPVVVKEHGVGDVLERDRSVSESDRDRILDLVLASGYFSITNAA